MKKCIAILAVSAAALSGSLSLRAGDYVVSVPVASLRAAAAHEGALETQALLGTPVEIGEAVDVWFESQLPTGYRAWINRSAVAKAPGWNKRRRVIVTNPRPCYITTDTAEAHGTDGGNVVSDLVFGCVLATDGRTEKGYTAVEMPDGRKGWVKSADICDWEEFVQQKPSLDTILDYAMMMLGTTYLWGGNSAYFVDCSGFTSIVYMMAGIQLPRNASQQIKKGIEVDFTNLDDIQAGDLIFFSSELGRINHVGLALGNKMMIHSSGRVKINSLDPAASNFEGRTPCAVRRILGTQDAEEMRYLNLPVWQ